MELYITVMFWMGIATIIIRVFSIGVLEWPKKRTYTLQMEISKVLFGLAFTVWAGIVLFVK